MDRLLMTSLRRLLLVAATSGNNLGERTIIGNPVSFNTNVAKPLRQMLIPFAPVQEGSGDPSPSNVRPITGWTGVNVSRAGKNLIDSSKRYVSGATMCFIGQDQSGYPLNLKAGTYTISCEYLDGEHYGMYYKEENDSSETSLWHATSTTTQKTFTLSSDGMYQFFAYRSPSSGGVDSDKIINVQLELGSPASSYEPYSGTTIPVVFPSEAGTVYGGTLDLTTGELTVEWEMMTLDSSIPSGTNGIRNITALSGCVRFEYFPYRSVGVGNAAPVISDKFSNALSINVPFEIEVGSGAPRLYLTLPLSYSSDELIRSWFSENPTQIVYELATPLAYQLTPEEITTIIGDNTVWADTNGENTIKYLKKG